MQKEGNTLEVITSILFHRLLLTATHYTDNADRDVAKPR